MVVSVSTGQNALCPLPPPLCKGGSQLLQSSTSSGNVGVPGQLRKNGIKVTKIGKNGKKTAMILTVSSDLRTLIFTYKRILFDTKQPRCIDISTIDRVQQGRTTKPFELVKDSKQESLRCNELNNCLSIIYLTKKSSGENKSAVALTNVTQNYWTSLDLIITNHNDYQILIQFLDDHLIQFNEYRSKTQKSILFLQHLWLQVGKTLSERMTPNEFGSLCDQLSIPLRKSKCIKLYHQYCKALSINPDEGVTIAQAVELLEHVRSMIVSTCKNDPFKHIWNKVTSYDSKNDDYEIYSDLIQSDSLVSRTMTVKCTFTNDESDEEDEDSDRESVCSEGFEVETELPIKVAANRDADGEPLISAYQFLKFLFNDQKDMDSRISHVQLLFQRLNGQTSACSLSENGHAQAFHATMQSSSKDFITQSTFFSFLISDANDLFNPAAAKYDMENLSEPLSSYWINTSHDTFLSTRPQDISSNNSDEVNHAQVSAQMITVALHRGCRCIELDVWDGTGQQNGIPIVTFGSETKADELCEGIPFITVVKSAYNFLKANSKSTPIIFSIENHCRDLENEKKMAYALKSILGSSDMLYEPDIRRFTGDASLPSPRDLLGKVVIQCKRPMQFHEASEVIYNDYDEVLDMDCTTYDEWKNLDRQEEDEYTVRRLISNFEGNTIAQIIGENITQSKAPAELVAIANDNAMKAKDNAVYAEKKAFMANLHVLRAGDVAMRLMKKAGLTISNVEQIISNQNKVKLPAREEEKVRYDTEDEDHNEEDDDTYEDDEDQEENLVEELARATKSFDKDRYDTTVSKWIRKSSVKAEELVTRAMARLGIVESYSSSESSDEYESTAHSSYETTTIDTNTQMEDTVRNFNCANEYTLLEPYNFVCGSQQQLYPSSDIVFDCQNDDEVWGDENKGALDEFKMRFIAADNRANQASSALIHSKAKVNTAVLKLRSAEDSLARAEKRKSDAIDNFNRRHTEMIACKEHAEVTEKLVHELKGLLKEAEVQVIQAELEYEKASEDCAYWDERAQKAEAVATSVRDKLTKEQQEAQTEIRNLSDMEPLVNALKAQAMTATNKASLAKQCLDRTIALIQNTDTQIQRIVSSDKYRDDQRNDILRTSTLHDLGNVHTSKYKEKIQERDDLSKLVMKQETEYAQAESARLTIQKEYDDAVTSMVVASKKRDTSNEKAGQLFIEVERVSTIAITERHNADVHLVALNKARTTLDKFVGLKNVVTQRLSSAEDASKEAKAVLLNVSEKLEASNREKLDKSDLGKYTQRVTKASAKLDEAVKRMEECSENKDLCDSSAARARSDLDKRATALYKGKLEEITSAHKNTAKRQLEKNAISLYKRYVFLQEVAEKSLHEADFAKKHAAEQVAIAKQAEEYKEKKAFMRPIHPDLARLTFLHSTRFGYIEKSLSYPFHYMHSISESQLIKLMNEPGFDVSLWQEFSNNHILRTFPSRHENLRKISKNMNPLLPWSMGCQAVAINTQVFDAFVLVNDGRFRQNGSCGYVLKPPHLANLKNQIYSSVNDPEHIAQEWQISVICAHNIPKVAKKGARERTNPRIRLTVYDGGTAVPQAFATKVIKRNGFAPVWFEDDDSFRFSVSDSSVAVILFSVWDCSPRSGREEFLGAAAIPVSCMRQGYRSVALFDANHMRGGDMAYASLLVKAVRREY